MNGATSVKPAISFELIPQFRRVARRLCLTIPLARAPTFATMANPQIMRPFFSSLLALVLTATTLLAQATTPDAKQTRLLRFPATNGSQIVFGYAGNLYTVGLDGGTARRLTST